MTWKITDTVYICQRAWRRPRVICTEVSMLGCGNYWKSFH